MNEQSSIPIQKGLPVHLYQDSFQSDFLIVNKTGSFGGSNLGNSIDPSCSTSHTHTGCSSRVHPLSSLIVTGNEYCAMLVTIPVVVAFTLPTLGVVCAWGLQGALRSSWWADDQSDAFRLMPVFFRAVSVPWPQDGVWGHISLHSSLGLSKLFLYPKTCSLVLF